MTFVFQMTFKPTGAPKVANMIQGSASVPESNHRRFALRFLPGLPRLTYVAALYLVAIGAAETTTTYFSPILGVSIHLLLLGGLVIQAGMTQTATNRGFLVALCLAPIIRIVSLSTPLDWLPAIWWYAAISVPLAASSFVVMRVVPLNLDDINFRWPRLRHVPLTTVVVVSGVAIGLVEYLILDPRPIVGSLGTYNLVMVSMIYLIATGLIEEVMFRGIIQTVAIRAFGVIPAVLFVSILFGVLHTGHRSWLDVAFVAVVGFYFSLIVIRTKSLLGVTLAHGCTNVVLFAVLPNTL